MNNFKKRVVVLTSYPDPNDGVDLYSQLLKRYHEKMGINVTFVGVPKKMPNSQVTTEYIHVNRLSISSWVKAAFAVKKTSVPFIHVQYNPTMYGPFLPIFFSLLVIMRIKILLTAHEKPSEYHEHFNFFTKQIFRIYEFLVFLFCKKIVVHTQEHKNELKTEYYIDTKCILGPFGALLDYENTKFISDDEINSYIPNTDHYLVSVGHIAPRKGLEYLIRSISELNKLQHKQLGLVIIGNHTSKNINYINFLNSLIIELNLEGKIIFTGFLHDSHSVPIIKKSVGLVSFALKKTLSGLIFREVSACRIPIAVTDVGNMGSTVKKYGIGEVSPDHSIPNLITTISKLTNSGTSHYYSGIESLRTNSGADKVADFYLHTYIGLSRKIKNEIDT